MIGYANEALTRYLDDLAAKQETPGGGSVCGLVGSLAAGLGSMVCQYTIGKKKYAAVEEDVRRILADCEAARGELLGMMQEDVVVFQTQMAGAYGMPKDTEQQAAARKAAIEAACKAASGPPMKIARRCRDLLGWLAELGEKGSVLLVSDVGVGVALAKGAFEGACLNVRINLNFINDSDFVEKLRGQMAELADEVNGLAERGMRVVGEKMG